MKKKNSRVDFILGGVLLIMLGLLTIYWEKVFLTVKPVITLQETPILFWIVVILKLGFGSYLFYRGVKNQVRN